jgi:quinol monooxygenase YgiN
MQGGEEKVFETSACRLSGYENPFPMMSEPVRTIVVISKAKGKDATLCRPSSSMPLRCQQDRREPFLAAWHKQAEHLRHAPGFHSTRLHQSLDPQVTFRFINVAECGSPPHWQQARESEEFQQLRTAMPSTFRISSALYEVVAH